MTAYFFLPLPSENKKKPLEELCSDIWVFWCPAMGNKIHILKYSPTSLSLFLPPHPNSQRWWETFMLRIVFPSEGCCDLRGNILESWHVKMLMCSFKTFTIVSIIGAPICYTLFIYTHFSLSVISWDTIHKVWGLLQWKVLCKLKGLPPGKR